MNAMHFPVCLLCLFAHGENPDQKQEIETLFDRILAAKQSDPIADVQPLETRIDHLVYHLYNLTPEEITIVEGKK